MFKISNIPNETMDIIMEVARKTQTRPDKVIVKMLSLVTINEAMIANEKGQDLQVEKWYKS